METKLALVLAIGAMLSGCTSRSVITSEEASQPVLACKKIESFFKVDLSQYQDRIDEKSQSYQIEQWKIETADPEGSLKLQSFLFEVLQRVIYDKTILEKVNRLNQQIDKLKLLACPWVPRLKRVAAVLSANIVTDPKVSELEKLNQDWQDRLQKASNDFRVQLPDETAPVSLALVRKKLSSTGDKAARERLFKGFGASRAQKWTELGFKDLVRSRNEEAKAAGYSDYYAYRFFRNGLDLNGYWENLSEVKTKLAPKAHKVLKELGMQHGVSKVDPWDFRYLREQASSGVLNPWFSTLSENGPMEIARKFYAELGFNTEEYGFKTDLLPRAGKNTHAFAMAVVFPRTDDDGQLMREPVPDIRFLANLKKPVKWDDVSTVIHELGHAIHAAEVRQPTAIFRGFDSVPTEAMAMALERFANSPQFLQDTLIEFCRVPSRDSSTALKRHIRAARLDQAFTLLRQLLFTEFERAIYLDPNADYGKLWAKLSKEYWGMDLNPEFADWDIDHFLMAPVYVQNYALGILMVEQIFEVNESDYSSLSRKRLLGDRIRDLWFRPGTEYDYLELTEKLSRKKLSAAPALKLLD